MPLPRSCLEQRKQKPSENVIDPKSSGFVSGHLVEGSLSEAVDSVRLDASLKKTLVKEVNNHPLPPPSIAN